MANELDKIIEIKTKEKELLISNINVLSEEKATLKKAKENILETLEEYKGDLADKYKEIRKAKTEQIELDNGLLSYKEETEEIEKSIMKLEIDENNYKERIEKIKEQTKRFNSTKNEKYKELEVVEANVLKTEKELEKLEATKKEIEDDKEKVLELKKLLEEFLK